MLAFSFVFHYGFRSRLYFSIYSRIIIRHISLLSLCQQHHFRFSYFKIYFVDNRFSYFRIYFLDNKFEEIIL
jgi:hypothetical protein